MTRTMGDATHDQVAALHAANTQMVAGYVTGSADIRWTSADFAMFAGKPQVTIDQGFTGSPVATADVRDVEPGAWTVAAAVNRTGWAAARPTIYISAGSLPSLEAAGWKGDVWVANYISNAPTAPYPVPAGMNCVAWQWTNTGGGGAYDLSVVFDPAWPASAPAPVTVRDDDLMIIQGASGAVYLLNGGRLHHVVDTASLALYRATGIPTVSTAITAAEEAALLADFPPGNPVVTANSTVPNLGADPVAGAPEERAVEDGGTIHLRTAAGELPEDRAGGR